MLKQENNEQQPIFSSVTKNEKYLSERMGIGVTFDVGIRQLTILETDVHLYFVNGLCDSNFIIEILETLFSMESTDGGSVVDAIEDNLAHQQVSPITLMGDLVTQLLSGLIIILVDGEAKGFAVDVRSYPGRTPSEPKTEKVITGPQDGFVENLIMNTGLIRRRIRDEKLRNEIIKVGSRSKTDICISYLQDVANPDLVDIIKQELQAINVDGISMVDKAIEEYLIKQGYNPFPQIKTTERPDVAATHLLEGHVLIIIDTSPAVMVAPTTYFHHLQHVKEYRMPILLGTVTRMFRFLALFINMFMLPLWLTFVLNPKLLPNWLDFIGPSEKSNLPIVVQIIIAIIALEFLIMAALHTPNNIMSAFGLVAAALIGQIAIDVGLFLPEVVLYSTIAVLSSFALPSHELGESNRIVSMVFIVFVYFFHEEGFMVGLTLLILYLASRKPLQSPYLWPFLPFNPAAFLSIFVRTPMASDKKRPSIVKPLQHKRQT